MKGVELKMPEGYSVSGLDGDHQMQFKQTSLNVWAHGDSPSDINTPLMSIPGWIQLAESIHKHV